MNSEKENDVEKNTEGFQCNGCKTSFGDRDKMKTSDAMDVYCESCYEDKFFECSECGEESLVEDAVDYYGDMICESCFDNNFWRCDNCSEVYRNGDVCESCEENDDYNIPERDYSTSNKYAIQSERAYSCEMECYYPSGRVMREIADEIPEEIGITGDGSLNNNGIEFNTPKLSGAKGRKLLEEFTTKLVENDFKVNATCGLHIHLNASDFLRTRNSIQKLMIFYMLYEDVIMSFLPMSRRDNHYCLPLTEFYHLNEVKNTSSIEDLEEIWYRDDNRERINDRKKDRHDSSRYAGINFHSLLANGHLEIRYHSGTLNFEKIINWIKLNVIIMDKIVSSCSTSTIYDENGRESKLSLRPLLKTKFTLGLPEKTKTFFDLLDLPTEMREFFIKRQKQFSSGSAEEN